MTIRYHSLDPVHCRTAGKWTRQLLREVREDGVPRVEIDIYDVDFLWADRTELVDRLVDEARFRSRRGHLVVVHGYGLDADAVRRLRAVGIMTSPRLNLEVLREAFRRGRRRLAAFEDRLSDDADCGVLRLLTCFGPRAA